MNKIYRIVWNEARGAFVVAHEKSKANGKPSSTRKVVASAVTLALMSLNSTAVFATPTCPYVLNPSQSTQYTLNPQGLSVSSGVSVIVVAGTAAVYGNGNANSTICGLTNSGTITGYTAGIKLNSSNVSGGITNSGTISDAGGHGIGLYNSTVSGGINNSGTLSGIYASVGGIVGGGIINSSTISGTGIKFATGSSLSGGITNSGKITNSNNEGLLVKGATISGTIWNQSGGTISGATNEGIHITNDFSGSVKGQVSDILNDGSISGSRSFNGIHIDGGTVTGGIVNSASGVISGAGGIYLTAAPFHAGGALVGNISNAGTISAYVILTGNSTVTGTIDNSGYIADRMKVKAHSTVSGGIVNSGKIIAPGTTGFIMTSYGVSGGLTNSGTISGSKYAVYVDSTSTLSGISIAGADTAKFGGDVFAQNTPVTITSGSTFTGTNAFNVQSFNIASTGVFNIINTMPGLGTTTGAISNPGITVTQGITNAGTISVADGVTGNITGNYTQSSTGVYQLGASSSTSYGKLAVTGTAKLAGTAYVNVNSVNTIASGQTLSGVITSSGLTGNFASVGTNSNLFGFSSVANGNNVDLCIFSAGSSCGSSGGSNSSSTPSTVLTDIQANGNNPGAGAAVIFDNLIAQGIGAPAAMAPVVTALGKFTTSQEVSNAVAQTLPLHTGGETPAITASLHSVNHIVQSRQEGEQGRSSGDGFIEDGKAWVKPFGSYANQGGYEGVNGFKAYTGGVVIGADADVNSTHRIGLALAVASSNVSGNSAVAPQSSNVVTYQLAIYGSHSLNDTTDINFQADVGDHNNSGNRGIPFMGSNAQSNYRSLSEQLGVGIAHTMKLSDVNTFTPTARVDYTTVHNNGYTERGAGALNLIVNSTTVNELFISADGKFTHNVNEKSIVTANLGVGYNAQNKQASIVSAFAGEPTATFTTLGMNPSPWIARGGLGYVRKEKATEMMLRYDVDANTSHFVGQTLSARLRWSF